jgi:hypothetical protein
MRRKTPDGVRMEMNKMNKVWQLRAGLMSLLVLSAACGASRSTVAGAAPTTGATGTEPGSRAIAVQVDNQNLSDMNIYIVNGTKRWLVGQVGGRRKTTFGIAPGLAMSAGRVRLVADGAGAAVKLATPPLLVAPGQSIFWTLGSTPSSSTATVG